MATDTTLNMPPPVRLPAPERPAAVAVPPCTLPPPTQPASPDAAREAWLFRHAVRAGEVHPLRPLLRRYRAGERV